MTSLWLINVLGYCCVSGMMGMPNQGMYNMGGYPGGRPPMFPQGGRY